MSSSIRKVNRRLNFDVSSELPATPSISSDLPATLSMPMDLSTSPSIPLDLPVLPSMPMDLSPSPSIPLDLPVAPSNSSEILATTPPRICSTTPKIPTAPRKKFPLISRTEKLRRIALFLESVKSESNKEEQQQQNSKNYLTPYCPETALSLWIHRKYNQDYIVKEIDFQKSYAKYLREKGLSDFPDIEKVDLKIK